MTRARLEVAPSLTSDRLSLLSLVLLIILPTNCSLFRPSFPESIALLSSRADTGTLYAGAAAVPITPEGSVFLAGYQPLRKSEGVHDPLFARALVLQRGSLRLAFVAVDVIGIQRQTVLDIRARVEGIEPHHLLISSTHTHGGPDTLGLWGLPPFLSGIDPEHQELLIEGILTAVSSAIASLQPAKVGWNRILAPETGLLRNRRRPGVVDREIIALHVLTSSPPEVTIATVTDLGCHPTVLPRANRQITSDFPHFCRVRLERGLGGVAMFVPGALGGHVVPDLEPGDTLGDRWREAARTGEELAELTLAAIRGIPHYEAQPLLSARHLPIYLRSENFRFDLARWTGLLNRDLYEGGYFESEVNLWRLGDLRIASVPGEITPDLGLRIKRAIGGSSTLLVGLGNDQLGYLLPEADFELPLYAYERKLSPGPTCGDRVVQRLEDLSLLSDMADGSIDD